MVIYWEFQTSFMEGKHVEKHLSSKFKLLIVGTYVTFISICNVKQVQKCHLFTRKNLLEEFCLPNWTIGIVQVRRLFWTKNKHVFCPPSDWWHSTFSAFFFENNALWQLCFVVQVARNFCPTCTVAVERFQASTRGPSNPRQLKVISTRS